MARHVATTGLGLGTADTPSGSFHGPPSREGSWPSSLESHMAQGTAVVRLRGDPKWKHVDR